MLAYYPVKVAIAIWLFFMAVNLLSPLNDEIESWMAILSFGFLLGSIFASRFYDMENLN